MALSAAVIAGVTMTTPAAAHIYPWCAVGQGYGYPGECAYATYEQCQASVSGRRLYCNINPRFAYGPSPPVRRGRPAYPY
jgi:hypothetical protein